VVDGDLQRGQAARRADEVRQDRPGHAGIADRGRLGVATAAETP
jgi:hypothetical protein